MEPSEIQPSAFDDSPQGRRSTEHWIVLGAAAIGIVGLILIGLFLEPDERGYGTHERFGLKPCYPLAVWNFPCPGCGVTTSVARAAHGDLVGSFVTQPFGFFVAMLAVVFIAWAFVGQLRGRDLWIDLQTRDWFRWVVVSVTVMAFAWVYKIADVRDWL